jgi:hypothetical protein
MEHCRGVDDKIEIINADGKFLYFRYDHDIVKRINIDGVKRLTIANSTKRDLLIEKNPILAKIIKGQPTNFGETYLVTIPQPIMFGPDEHEYASTEEAKGFKGGAYRYADVTVIEDLDHYPYVSILADTGRFNTKCVDFTVNVMSSKKGSVYFNSKADALNFMGTLGYDVIEAFKSESFRNTVFHYYLMRKKNG